MRERQSEGDWARESEIKTNKECDKVQPHYEVRIQV